jgi:amino acid transporter
MRRLKRFVFGSPIHEEEAHHERLSKRTALAVFSSDALSSVAYATEEILLVLAAAVPVIGPVALGYSLPIAAGIVALLMIVAISYRQTIHTYPNGGGAYIVSRENLGELPGLTAAAALLVDYILTVAVSITAGVAAITSAFEPLRPYTVELCGAAILLIALANLRGLKESGTIFAVPTYLFIGSLLVLIAVGLVKHFWLGGATLISQREPRIAIGTAAQGLTLFLLLRAYASGCTALTGVEAISNGIPAFKPPESRNAATTLSWMVATLITLFVGVTILAYLYRIGPSHEETVISQIARAIFGGTAFAFFYYIVQVATTLTLILAANTSYADFPRLASILAQDGYMPMRFLDRGDRLVFNWGIYALTAFALLLVVAFHGDTHALIPLYAIGVFLSFTLSQAGMVRHWLKEREASLVATQSRIAHHEAIEEVKTHHDGPEPTGADSRPTAMAEMTEVGGWRKSIVINAVGAVVTAVVLIVFVATKFTHGAWMVIVLLPILVLLLLGMKRHYVRVGRELRASLERLDPAERFGEDVHTVIVLVSGSGFHRGVVTALRYAQSIAVLGRVRAVHVSLDKESTEKLQAEWDRWSGGVPLVVLPSPYRSLCGPLMEYLDEVQAELQHDIVTVVIPEAVSRRWWHHLLHNQNSLAIKSRLLFQRHNVRSRVKAFIVTNVPYYLFQEEEWIPEPTSGAGSTSVV